MRHLVIASCVAAVCSVGLAAQAQTPGGSTSKPQSPPTSSPASKDQPGQRTGQSAEGSMVLRGCLRTGDQAGSFVLANASATSGGTLKNATVELVGSPAGANLKDHVGHTVEVTGMLAGNAGRTSAAAAGEGTSASSGGTTGAGAGSDARAGTTGSGAGTTGAGTGSAASAPAKSGAAGTAGDRARLNVKSIKHVKETCGA
jgi:hypothetical protein